MTTSQVGSALWSTVNQTSRLFYRSGLFVTTRLPCRVISVGNLQAGGAGKTPLVMKIAREAVNLGLRVCVLSRGYRSVWEKTGGVVFPEQIVDPALCGDEVTLVHAEVPEVWIGVGADRISQFKKISETLKGQNQKPIDLVILDDGFQHFKLYRDLDVIAVTDATPDERVFRDSWNAIPDDALLVLTKGNSFPAPLQRHPHRVKVSYSFLKPPASVHYFLVCGLANPVQAKAALETAGYSIRSSVFLADHRLYQVDECNHWVRLAKEAGLKILLTGKDAVKWAALGISSVEYDVVEPEVKIEQGAEIWRSLLWQST